MSLNLIHDAWIPVRRASGRTERIAPWEIADPEDVALVLASTRPDFNGALAQFLIGLLQTTLAAENDEQWAEWLEHPLAVATLREAFENVAYAFELDADGPRFMQDYSTLEVHPKPISTLLIEAPGDQALRQNTDHFIKRNREGGFCPPCAATALFALQTNAPAGGSGHRTSLRGGGPLSTLVVLDPAGSGLRSTLWRNLWMNVLPAEALLTGNPAKDHDRDKFPWLAPTRTSGKDGHVTTAQDVNPVQMYWGMPRRIRLDFETWVEGDCGICGQPAQTMITQYFTLNHGVNYTGAWRHPLSPYRLRAEEEPFALRPQPGGISYQLWPGLVYGQTAEGKGVERAQVVAQFLHKRLPDEQLRLSVFGYDMDKMKARCWYEATLPLYFVAPALRERFTNRVSRLIGTATQAADLLKGRVKDAWFKRASDARGDTNFIRDAFFGRTESPFFAALHQLSIRSTENHDAPILAAWHVTIERTAIALFDEFVTSADIAFSDPRRIAVARARLYKQLHSKKLKGTLIIEQQQEDTV